MVFGRKLKDILPYGGLQAGPMVHSNTDIDKIWRDTWDLKEKALRKSYLKSVEKLDTHSKLQDPLNIADKVLIQNQAGRFATKWEKTGTVMEIHPNDQYTVKVDGSGRLTLRNRQFLRKAVSHNFYGTKPSYPGPSSPVIPESVSKNTDMYQESVPAPRVEEDELVLPAPPLPETEKILPPETDHMITLPQVSIQPPVAEVNSPRKPATSRLEREMKRLGSHNLPGRLETTLPTSRTRSGKVLNEKNQQEDS